MEKEIKIITDVEWHESRNTPFGTTHYPNRPSRADIEGLPIAPPRIVLRKDFKTGNYEYINIRNPLT